jgi:putative ABC transport system substrate-binding protein
MADIKATFTRRLAARICPARNHDLDAAERVPGQHVTNRRRFFATAAAWIGASLVAGSSRAATQHDIGFLSPLSSREEDPVLGPFVRALRVRGHREGENLRLHYRCSEGKAGRLDAFAEELVALKVELIVAVAPPAIHAARKATATIPIVMAFSGDDPVRSGFVASLAKPGGNITGLTILAPDLSAKRLELIREIVPTIGKVAVLANPSTQTSLEQLENVRAVARTLGVQIRAEQATTPGELEAAFGALARERPQMLLVLSDPLFFAERRRLAALAFAHRLPMMADWKEAAQAGALVTYGPDIAALADRAAVFVDRILKGTKPSALPVEQPSRFELVVNLRTAKVLGVTIPSSVLLRADEIIE